GGRAFVTIPNDVGVVGFLVWERSEMRNQVGLFVVPRSGGCAAPRPLPTDVAQPYGVCGRVCSTRERSESASEATLWGRGQRSWSPGGRRAPQNMKTHDAHDVTSRSGCWRT